MSRYLLRLDDASDFMNLYNWIRMKELLDRYGVKPVYGIIPDNHNSELLKYERVYDFWNIMAGWNSEGWIPAMHGCTHVFETANGGINPVNKKSEFAGLPLEYQKKKIREGYKILSEHDLMPNIFFAPAHTFDRNTLKALYAETPIRVISDTIANDVYYNEPFYYIPQQSGRVRRLPFKTVTFCYHPNIMSDDDFRYLETFLKIYKERFMQLDLKRLKKRRPDRIDIAMSNMYFLTRSIRKQVNGRNEKN